MNIRGLTVLAVGDLYIPCEAMRDALASLKPSRLTEVEWKAADEAELQGRLFRIEGEGPDAVPPPDEIWAHLADAELLMTHICPVSRKVVEAAPKLRLLGLCRGGTDSIDHAALKERGVRVFSAPGRNANAVAEMAVALMIVEARNIARAHASLASGGWRKNYSNDRVPGELRGKTVGIIGLGNVGRRVAAILSGFGVKLIVSDPFLSKEFISAHGGEKVELDELLRRADFVSLHARRDPTYPPLIGAAELSCMKPTAYFVNTARTYLVDEKALVRALQRGQIAGAAIDVFSQEPLPADSPLRSLDNVTLIPHLAGTTLEAWHNTPRMVVQSMLEALG